MPQQNWQEIGTGSDLEPLGAATPTATSAWLPMIAGVIATATIVELLCPALHPQSLSWNALLILAICLLVVAILVSGTAARAVCYLIRRGLPGSSGPIVRAACLGGLWVPAWVLCMREPSILTVFAGCFCVASLSRSIKRYDFECGVQIAETYGCPQEKLFQIRDSTPLVRVILPSLILAVFVEVTATAIIAKNYLAASILAASCIATLIWRSVSKASPIKVEQTHSRTMFGMGLAFAFTLIVLLPYLRSIKLSGSLASLLRRNSSSESRADKREVQSTSNDGYSGIILLPPTDSHKKIVAPQHKDAAMTGGRMAQPLVIPFDGAYWYFKAPDKRPRPTARIVRQSSTKAVIRSSDSYPLLMEAHQKLDTPIELSCCTKVEVVVLNADRHPGTIALELWLMNRALPASRYLGTAVIPSSESGRSSMGSAPTEETMEFLVPADLPKSQFNEITIVVRTPPIRSRTGAQIAIRRFVLHP
jgi:hypothetical protein